MVVVVVVEVDAELEAVVVAACAIVNCTEFDVKPLTESFAVTEYVPLTRACML